MSDIIQLLPDSVANQIAAGEVIQRPASVVKELIENAVDAGAVEIKVIIKDAGKTLVQVIDSGNGMSETDARMAFERHATSKISKAEDLFSIRTMGFRGEALASIAAVAQVELKTKQANDELGTQIIVNASELISQETVACSKGTNFTVKNLFYNIPARRKFLKKNSTELKHIENEFLKVALTHRDIDFSLIHNDSILYKLPASGLRQRIVNIFGKNFNQHLIPVSSETSIMKISGFIGKPEIARKKKRENFFFVNNRYMRHSYFHKAVSIAYEHIISKDSSPVYFLYFDISPDLIDINIHPQKTEINFDNTHGIFQILRATVKEALGKYNIAPSIDFDKEGAFDIEYLHKGQEVKQPGIPINTNYNPFETEQKQTESGMHAKISQTEKNNLENWETLYSGFEKKKSNFNSTEIQTDIESFKQQTYNKFFQVQQKYIATPVKSGLMLINIKRANQRIFYERVLNKISTNTISSQQTLYPENIELSPQDFVLVSDFIEDINKIGFDINIFGKNTIILNGTPSYIENTDVREVFANLLELIKSENFDLKQNTKEQIAGNLAKIYSYSPHVKLTPEEMTEITDNLFACEMPNFSPDGKPVIVIIDADEIDKKFK